jgi:hypothetical protein
MGSFYVVNSPREIIISNRRVDWIVREDRDTFTITCARCRATKDNVNLLATPFGRDDAARCQNTGQGFCLTL